MVAFSAQVQPRADHLFQPGGSSFPMMCQNMPPRFSRRRARACTVALRWLVLASVGPAPHSLRGDALTPAITSPSGQECMADFCLPLSALQGGG